MFSFVLEESERGQPGDACLLERRVEGNIEGVERLQGRDARELEGVADPAGLPIGEFFLEEPIEEVGVGPGFLLGGVEGRGQRVLEGEQAQAGEIRLQTVADELGHVSTSPRERRRWPEGGARRRWRARPRGTPLGAVWVSDAGFAGALAQPLKGPP